MEPVMSSPPVPITLPPGHSGRPNSSDGSPKIDTPKPAAARVKVDAPSPEEIKQAIEAANRALKAISSNLEFAQDPSTGISFVRIVDATTKQVIRQFPSEEMLDIARAVDRMQGVLLEEKA